MDRSLREFVALRALNCCEYCQMPAALDEAAHEVDHIIAEKHDGPTVESNLALACFACNNHKGPNIAGHDPVSNSVIRLFNPRVDEWSEHFEWSGPILIGRTIIGQVTIRVLAINLRHRVEHRRALIEEGVFPPTLPPQVRTRRPR